MDVKQHFNQSGKNKGTVDEFSLAAIVTSSISFTAVNPNGGNPLAGGSRSSILSMACCIWNGWVEIDVLSRFNRTAMLTLDPFEFQGWTIFLNHTAETVLVSVLEDGPNPGSWQHCTVISNKPSY